MQYDPTGVPRQKITCNGVQFFRPLANQDDRLVGYVQPGEILIHPVEDALSLRIEKQRVPRLRLGIECDEQSFLLGGQLDFRFLIHRMMLLFALFGTRKSVVLPCQHKLLVLRR